MAVETESAPLASALPPQDPAVGAEPKLNEEHRLNSTHFKIFAEKVTVGREVATDLLKALQSRADAEERYAAELKGISTTLDKAEVWRAGSTLSEGIIAYQQYLKELATSHQKLSDDINEEVNDTLFKMVSNHKMVLHSIQQDVADIKKKEDAITQRDLQNRSRLFHSSVDIKTTLKEALGVQPTLQIHHQESSKFHDAAFAVSEKEQKALLHRSTFTKFSANKEKQLDYIMTSMVDMDMKRRSCCVDSLNKALVFDLSHLRNSIYEAEKLTKPYELLSCREDQDEAFRDTTDSVPPSAQPGEALEPSLTWMEADAVPGMAREEDDVLSGFVSNVSRGLAGIDLKNSFVAPLFGDMQYMMQTTLGKQRSISSQESIEEIRPAGDGGFDAALEWEPEAAVTLRDIDEVFEGLSRGDLPVISEPIKQHVERYRTIIRSVMDGDLSVLTLENGEAIKDELSSSIFRGVLLEALSQILEDSNGEAEISNMVAFRLITKLVQWALDWSVQQSDSYFPQWVVCKAPYFFVKGATDEDPQQKSWHWPKTEVQRKKMEAKMNSRSSKMALLKLDDTFDWSLQNSIYNHKLFNRVAFWERALAGLLAQYQVLTYLEAWWATDDYTEEVKEKYRLLYYLKIAPCLPEALETFAATMQNYGIADVQIDHMVMKLTTKYQISSELTSTLYSHFTPSGGVVKEEDLALDVVGEEEEEEVRTGLSLESGDKSVDESNNE